MKGDRPFTITKDLRDITAEDLQGFDAVAHLAELSNDPLGQQDPSITYEINHQGSVRLADLARKAGVKRFVYTSSCSAYGAAATAESSDFVNEETEPNPQTAYAECKVKVEQDVSKMADDDFTVCFLRNATAFGASPRMRFDIVLNNLTGVAWTTKEIKLASDGTPWRPMVHALDIAKAIHLSLTAPSENVQAQIMNVGSNEQNYQIIELAKIVANTIPGCELTIGNSDGDNRSYMVNFDKIHRLLPDFKCEWSAERGAKQLVEMYKSIDMTKEVFEADPYTRIKELLKLRKNGLLDDKLFWT
jgi:nucleoside-diphosphate-sugar epimerase